MGLNLSPSPEHTVHQDTEQSREDYQNNYRPQLEDIPELEDEEENWEEGQFLDADLIDHHNTIAESDQLHPEYSACTILFPIIVL